jgi:hypothetical protein
MRAPEPSTQHARIVLTSAAWLSCWPSRFGFASPDFAGFALISDQIFVLAVSPLNLLMLSEVLDRMLTAS